MRSDYKQDQQFRLIVAMASIMIAVVFITALTFLLPLPEQAGGKIYMAEVLLDARASTYPFTIQNLMWLMFFLGLGELWVRISRASMEFQQIDAGLLPEDESTMLRSKDLVPIYQNILNQKSKREFFLQRLIRRIILQFQSSQSIDQANSLMNSSLELIQHEVELRYNMLRYLVWLIPTLGFIGTVVGIALALSDAGLMPELSDSEKIKDWVKTLTASLGVAFNTTLVALIMSAILVFCLHIAQAREEMALNGAGQYCTDHLINRLYED